jgi:hypothetical protein
MTNLPPIPEGRDWSPETWRAGLDEAVRRDTWHVRKVWADYYGCFADGAEQATIAHATTLLDAGIVKPVVSEAENVWREANDAWVNQPNAAYGTTAAIAVIDAALAKARAGE